MNEDLHATKWSNVIYPCAEECGFIGPLDAFTNGDCYDPCPRCGAKRRRFKTGRFWYRYVPRFKWCPWFQIKQFVRVEWREPKD